MRALFKPKSVTSSSASSISVLVKLVRMPAPTETGGRFTSAASVVSVVHASATPSATACISRRLQTSFVLLSMNSSFLLRVVGGDGQVTTAGERYASSSQVGTRHLT